MEGAWKTCDIITRGIHVVGDQTLLGGERLVVSCCSNSLPTLSHIKFPIYEKPEDEASTGRDIPRKAQ